jgi:FKBP-type peptidyl-prolyl cis-trans isomerase
MTHRVLVFLALVGAVSCNDTITGLEPPSDPATETFAASLGVSITSMTKLASGVYYADTLVGTGTVADTTTTDSVYVTYVGRLKNGTQFDAATNVLFVPAVLIDGVRLGMIGMKPGGKRKLVIPSHLGYGPRAVKQTDGSIKIPRQSTLVFDIVLLKVYNPVDTTKTALIAPSAGLRAAAIH